MTTYRVVVDQTITWEADVEADSEEEAERIVREDWLDDFETNPDDEPRLTFLACQDGSVWADGES